MPNDKFFWIHSTGSWFVHSYEIIWAKHSTFNVKHQISNACFCTIPPPPPPSGSAAHVCGYINLFCVVVDFLQRISTWNGWSRRPKFNHSPNIYVRYKTRLNAERETEGENWMRQQFFHVFFAKNARFANWSGNQANWKRKYHLNRNTLCVWEYNDFVFSHRAGLLKFYWKYNDMSNWSLEKDLRKKVFVLFCLFVDEHWWDPFSLSWLLFLFGSISICSVWLLWRVFFCSLLPIAVELIMYIRISAANSILNATSEYPE